MARRPKSWVAFCCSLHRPRLQCAVVPWWLARWLERWPPTQESTRPFLHVQIGSDRCFLGSPKKVHSKYQYYIKSVKNRKLKPVKMLKWHCPDSSEALLPSCNCFSHNLQKNSPVTSFQIVGANLESMPSKHHGCSLQSPTRKLLKLVSVYRLRSAKTQAGHPKLQHGFAFTTKNYHGMPPALETIVPSNSTQ